ncbi:MAG: hypothetical protein KDC41_14470, partial [Saprospiraceae bacterium]|nr:hypothetical protein [Saprospiraceae bacterium]
MKGKTDPENRSKARNTWRFLAVGLGLLLPLLSVAQTQGIPCDYPTLIRQAQALVKDTLYDRALLKYESARRCDPLQTAVVDSLIRQVFELIEEQKVAAVRNAREAERQRHEAETQKRIAQEALAAQSLAARQTVDLLLQNGRKEIYALRYDAALEYFLAAANLGEKKREVAEALLEVAYFWAEADKLDKALPVFQTAARHVA